MGTTPQMTNSTKSRQNMEIYALNAMGFLFLPVAAIATAQIWVLAVAGVVVILASRMTRVKPLLTSPNILLIALLAVFVGWAALSSFWSINPDRAIKTSIRLVLVAIALVVLIDSASSLDQRQRRSFGFWLIGGTFVGLIVTIGLILSSGAVSIWLGSTHLTGHELASLNRTSSIIALLVWPVALIIAQLYGRYAAATIVILSAVLLFALAPSTPLFAFIVSICAFGLAWLSHRWGKRMLLVAFAASVIMIPFLDILAPILIDGLTAAIPWPNSEVHRIVIWQFASEQILNHPFIGWGLDASRAIPGGQEQLPLFTIDDSVRTGQAMPLHPHSAVVQIWLELGLIGVLFFSAIFSMIVAAIPESISNHAAPATMIATAACAFTIAQLGFGIWQGWWMAALGLTATVVIASVSMTNHKGLKTPLQTD